MGEQLKRGERTVRELVVFNEEEITDEKLEARRRQLEKQLDRVRVAQEARHEARGEVRRRAEEPTSGSSAARSGRSAASRVELSRAIRKIEFTEMVKRRLIDGMKGAVEDMQAKQREVRLIDQKLDSKGKRKLREEEKKILTQAQGGDPQGNPRDGAEARAAGRRADDDAADDPRGRGAGRAGQEGAGRGQPPARRLDRRRSTRTAACSSST